jgi:hypothetical protein
MKQVEINLSNFKSLYEDAVKGGKEIFFYNGVPVVVGYAKYFIEYLESK